MQLELIDKFKNLPDELIHNIINYTDVVVYRNGKYINRLNKKDERYKVVMSIPTPMKIGSYRILLRLVNRKESNKSGYFIEYIIGFYIKINIKFVMCEKDRFDRYFNTKSFAQYIFDANSNWSKIINYSM
jgi:hypothetical protein